MSALTPGTRPVQGRTSEPDMHRPSSDHGVSLTLILLLAVLGRPLFSASRFSGNRALMNGLSTNTPPTGQNEATTRTSLHPDTFHTSLQTRHSFPTLFISQVFLTKISSLFLFKCSHVIVLEMCYLSVQQNFPLKMNFAPISLGNVTV